MKKNKKILILISSLVVLALLGGTFAALQDRGTFSEAMDVPSLEMKIIAGDGLDEVEDQVPRFAEGDTVITLGGEAGDNQKLVPGQFIENSYRLQAIDSVPMYVRVKMYCYWEKDGKVYTDFPEGKFDSDSISLNGTDARWIVSQDSKKDANNAAGFELYEAYYTEPIEGDDVTTNFLNGYTILPNFRNVDDNIYSGLTPRIEIVAEAVQAQNGEAAILAEWGAKATIDGAGNITDLEYE
ncbi:hypothetical protein [Ohessyouella blattaphilus]|uniref:Uncharacterized protein n=1 Tax=Ohessyouella blattaphilus TaxID=2949333 RepID=A0ABT1EN35_9FIRM|nr:hypothetical protein [Ohessyouella blattaphilus]MCP1111192.1 hypothetical protein [Ohessyouella blattaphilus]MCR8564586.1 hypothetical protein [Ohessyouella blattaphilus]